MKARKITEEEYVLCEWLILESNRIKCNEINKNSKVYPCGCGCSSFSFVKNIRKPWEVIVDKIWRNEKGLMNGIILYFIDEKIGGVDIYSLESTETICTIPKINQIIQNFDENI